MVARLQNGCRDQFASLGIRLLFANRIPFNPVTISRKFVTDDHLQRPPHRTVVARHRTPSEMEIIYTPQEGPLEGGGENARSSSEMVLLLNRCLATFTCTLPLGVVQFLSFGFAGGLRTCNTLPPRHGFRQIHGAEILLHREPPRPKGAALCEPRAQPSLYYTSSPRSLGVWNASDSYAWWCLLQGLRHQACRAVRTSAGGDKPPVAEQAKHFPPLRLAASPPIGAGNNRAGLFIRWLAPPAEGLSTLRV